VNNHHVEELILRGRLNAVHDVVYSRKINAKSVDGLTQHTEELKILISIHNIDVMLISEMHFTEKKLSKTSQLYSLYHMNHPPGTAQGGTARTFPIKSFAHDSERTLVCAKYGYPKGSPNTNS
jgi:hypothetical protein